MTAARFLLALLALIPLTLMACATGPLTLDDNLVVPGERIGEVQIGMPLATLLAVKGNPITTAPISGTDATTYTFDDGLTVGAQDEVYWIIAEDARFHTSSGVRPGVEQIFARASFGKPRCVESRGETTVYDYGDIYFDVDNAIGKVKRLGVVGQSRPCAG
ncbi:MAG: hypothetical protein EON61_19095 [Alphaproteobacteria bacterium]|nr:MAG: hypothetical protein EON61_19095 [Alphaproteobacteria bacterium]